MIGQQDTDLSPISPHHPSTSPPVDLQPFAAFPHVVWAVDADPEAKDLAMTAAALLHVLSPSAQILPIYVIGPGGLNWTGDTIERVHELLAPAARLALETTLEAAREAASLEHLLQPMIIEIPDASIKSGARQLVRKFLSRARKFHADLIVVGHRARTGWNWLFHSSFTELLTNESNLPLLAVTSRTRVPKQIRDIVFPTDFSPAGQAAFETCVTLARACDARIRLFHKITSVLDPIVQNGTLFLGGAWVPADDRAAPAEDESNSLGRQWVEYASQQGVRAEFVPEDSSVTTPEAIAAFCESCDNTLLVMTMVDGPYESGVWGNVTQDVLQVASCPILVLRD